MRLDHTKIQIISAPSILGLKPTGVQELPAGLLASGLTEVIGSRNEIITVETLNDEYNDHRDTTSRILNGEAIQRFSLRLGKALSHTMRNDHFPFVLGGDCSILIGIMARLKELGNNGLVFLDAHADFYEPKKSITGEVADMDLAIITARGPEIVTNINNLAPYVKDENIIHIGQRDQQETIKYVSQDIAATNIRCFSLATIRHRGTHAVTNEIRQAMKSADVDGWWIHFDTDVLSDDINPAVDYRIPGGLEFYEVETFIQTVLQSGNAAGLSITILNPRLDPDKRISKEIVKSLGRAFNPDRNESRVK